MNRKLTTFLIAFGLILLSGSCKKTQNLPSETDPQQLKNENMLQQLRDFSTEQKSGALDSALQIGPIGWSKKLIGITSVRSALTHRFLPIITADNLCHYLLDVTYSATGQVNKIRFVKKQSTSYSKDTGNVFSYVQIFRKLNGETNPSHTIISATEALHSLIVPITKKELSVYRQNAIVQSTDQSSNCLINVSWRFLFTYPETNNTYDHLRIAEELKNFIGQYLQYYQQYNEYQYWSWGNGGAADLIFGGVSGSTNLDNVCQQALNYAAQQASAEFNVLFALSDYSINSQNTCQVGGGGGTAPGTGNTEADPGVNYEVETANDGINIQDKLNCFNTLPKDGAVYSAKLCVDIPNNNDPQALIGPDKVGHSFITLTKTVGGRTMTESFGFYPKIGVKSLTYLAVPSQVEDNGLHSYDAAYDLNNLSETDFNAMIGMAVYLGQNMSYDLQNFNCTDYAIQVFNQGLDTNHQLQVPDWVVTKSGTNYGTTPSGLYTELAKMKVAGDSHVVIKTAAKADNSSTCN